jgi:hypothetical protein
MSRNRRSTEDNDNSDINRINSAPMSLNHAAGAQGRMVSKASVRLWTLPRHAIFAVSGFIFRPLVSLLRVSDSHNIDGVASHLPTVRGHNLLVQSLFEIRGRITIFLSSLYLKKMDDGNYLQLKLCGKSIRALLDTGSSISLIRSTLAHKLNIPIRDIQPGEMSCLFAAEGSKLIIDGVADITFNVSGLFFRSFCVLCRT